MRARIRRNKMKNETCKKSDICFKFDRNECDKCPDGNLVRVVYCKGCKWFDSEPRDMALCTNLQMVMVSTWFCKDGKKRGEK